MGLQNTTEYQRQMFQLGKKKVKNDFFFLDATVDWNNFATTFFSLFIVKLYLACTHVDRTHTQKWRSCFTNVSINGFCLKILQKSSESTTVFVFVPNGTKYFFFFFLICHVNSIPSEQIALPDLDVAGMENWGLITYQEQGLLYEENVSSQLQKNTIAILVAHEIAHQVSA